MRALRIIMAQRGTLPGAHPVGILWVFCMVRDAATAHTGEQEGIQARCLPLRSNTDERTRAAGGKERSGAGA